MADDPVVKRLRMRSWRRGIKEMDLILGPFADTALTGLDAPDRLQFEALLEENDHDLYQWVTARIGGRADEATFGPQHYASLLDRIAEHAASRIMPG